MLKINVETSGTLANGLNAFCIVRHTWTLGDKGQNVMVWIWTVSPKRLINWSFSTQLVLLLRGDWIMIMLTHGWVQVQDELLGVRPRWRKWVTGAYLWRIRLLSRHSSLAAYFLVIIRWATSPTSHSCCCDVQPQAHRMEQAKHGLKLWNYEPKKSYL
jgi:hypothetical protein